MAAIASPSRPPVMPCSMSAMKTRGNLGSNAMMIALTATILRVETAAVAAAAIVASLARKP